MDRDCEVEGNWIIYSLLVQASDEKSTLNICNIISLYTLQQSQSRGHLVGARNYRQINHELPSERGCIPAEWYFV